MAKVSLVAGENRKENIRKALELIKDEVKPKGKVLIKPNLTGTTQEYANTHVDALKGLIEFLNEKFQGLEIVVGESSGTAYLHGRSTKEVFQRFGYYGLEEYGNVKVVDLDEWKEFQEMGVKSVVGGDKIRVVRHNFDYTISLAIPKTHDFAIATLGIKNMVGMVHREDRVLIHGFRGKGMLQGGRNFIAIFPEPVARVLKEVGKYVVTKFSGYGKSVRVINRNLAELAKLTKPDLVVVDGLYGMEGEGPVLGEGIKMGVAFASADPLKADGLGVRLMGLEPEDIGYLYYLEKGGFGDYSLEGLVGEDWVQYQKKFKMHPKYSKQVNWK